MLVSQRRVDVPVYVVTRRTARFLRPNSTTLIAKHIATGLYSSFRCSSFPPVPVHPGGSEARGFEYDIRNLSVIPVRTDPVVSPPAPSEDGESDGGSRAGRRRALCGLDRTVALDAALLPSGHRQRPPAAAAAAAAAAGGRAGGGGRRRALKL
eukprot:tig00001177_g7375.t1